VKLHARLLSQLVWVTATALLATAAQADTFTVSSNVDSGFGSLRQAILDASANPGADTISFNIGGGAGPHTITLLSPLPQIVEAVTIDGYSQPGSSMNTLPGGSDAVLLIELDGSSAGGGAEGLRIAASSCVVQGLVINRFDGHGI
jgi:hypothetical protein